MNRRSALEIFATDTCRYSYDKQFLPDDWASERMS